MRAGSVVVTWQGERGQTLRATLGVDRRGAAGGSGTGGTEGRQVVHPRARSRAGNSRLRRLQRRISAQQEVPLRQLGIFTPEVIERQKWFAFWDAPLNVPGHPGSNAAVGLPRKPEEIQKTWAKFHITGCEVNTDGARIEANFPGVTAGVFSGGLRYTVYRGTNLLRQEIIAKTDAPSVAYEFAAGLKGFAITDDTPP